MKIRIYSPFLPYPVTEGAFRVIYDQAFSLQALGHEVELVTWKNTLEEFRERSLSWTTHAPRFNHLGPQKDSRVRRIVSSLFRNEASPENYYYPTSVLPHLATLPPCDLAIYHYSFAHLWLKTPNRLPQEKRRVVHFHNLESELSFLQAQNSKNLKKWIHLKNYKKLKTHEGELLELCPELWFLSPPDLQDFQSRTPSYQDHSAILKLMPPTFSSAISLWSKSLAQPDSHIRAGIQTLTHLDTQPQTHPESKANILGFIGGYDFQPNIDSAQWIVQRLVPALERAGFQGKIHFAGRGAQRVIPTLMRSPKPWIEVLPDDFKIDTFFANISWMLVPHLTGSGVRIKLLDALSKKIPVMATSSAVERLHPEIQTSSLILTSDDPDAWAKKAVEEPLESTRYHCQMSPFPIAMDGMEIYKNV